MPRPKPIERKFRRLTVREVIERQYKRSVIQVYYGKDEATWYDRFRHFCPSCLRSLGTKREINFCPACGQRLDWEHMVSEVRLTGKGKRYSMPRGQFEKRQRRIIADIKKHLEGDIDE